MSWIDEMKSKMGHLVGRGRFDAEMREEMETHLAMRAEELEGEGVPREEAWRRARVEFGSAARIEEETRDAWRFGWVEELVSDLRYAGRALAHAPGYALAAVLSLALGTGANTAMFSLTSEFLLSEPTVREPERLVALRVAGASHTGQREYQYLKDAGLYEGLAGIREEGGVNWRVGEETYRLNGMRVTGNYFAVTGTPVWLGRGIEEGETDAVVAHHRFWRTRLGAREDAVGRALVLDGRVYRLVGVLPEAHRTLIGLGFSPDLYLPVTDAREVLKPVARLGAGVTREQALEQLKAACDEMDRAFPPVGGTARRHWTKVEGFTSAERLSSRKAIPLALFFGMLLVVSGLVLVVACVNVASLNLARAESRRQEVSIRMAMGAGRWRVARQMMAESVLLAGLGTVCGVGLTAALGRWASEWTLPLPVPVRLNVHPDWRLLGYAVVVAVGCALVAGWIPAMEATRGDVQSGLKSGERNVAGGRRRMRSVLVAAQLGVTTVVLAAALLFLRNLGQASATDPGFDTERTVWAAMRLAPERYGTSEQMAAAAERALERVRAVAGVESAALCDVVPLNDSVTIGTEMKTDLDGRGRHVRAQLNRVSPDYFRTMGISLVAGREFAAGDREGSTEVVIVNETMAGLLFGGRGAVGHTVSWEMLGSRKVLEVVGVARNSKYLTIGEDPSPALYTPWRQERDHGANVHVMVRSSRPAEGLVRELRGALLEVDGTASVEVRPMKAALALAFLPSRAGAWLLGSMGGLGLLLGALGLYGVLAYTVNRRVREIGVRVALGAGPWGVARLVFGQSLWLVCVGAGAGLGVSYFAMQPLARFLVPGVGVGDASTFVMVGVVLGVVALGATAGPVWRALRVEPARALRME